MFLLYWPFEIWMSKCPVFKSAILRSWQYFILILNPIVSHKKQSLKPNNRSCFPQVSSKELKLLTEQLNEVYNDDNYPKNLIKYHDVPKLGRIYAIRELGKVQKHSWPVQKLRNTILGISRPPPFLCNVSMPLLCCYSKGNPQSVLRNCCMLLNNRCHQFLQYFIL